MPTIIDQGQYGPNQKNIPPPPWTNPNTQAWAAKLRPLSDIRELTEPSLIDTVSRRSDHFPPHMLQRVGSLSRFDGRTRQAAQSGTLERSTSQRSNGQTKASLAMQKLDLKTSVQLVDADAQSDHSSAYSLSLENVPPKSLSKHRLDVPAREKSLPHLRMPEPSKQSVAIPDPILRSTGPHPLPANAPGKATRHLDGKHREPRTFIRTIHPNVDILDYPVHRHTRLNVDLQVGSSLFVGGASIDGNVRITVPELERSRHRRQLAISRISIDLLGIEEASGGRRAIFLNLASELVDPDNPPPHRMVESLKQISPIDPFWVLAPSISTLPFSLALPLEVGPSPFHSKNARIRYLLAATVLIRDHGKHYLVRSSQDISVLSVYDPEKALVSLPCPLTVSDEYIRQRDPFESVKATAGLHRQVWVSSTSIFVDISIENSSKKHVKRLELQLERDILCYNHAVATVEPSGDSVQSRIFDFNERTIINKQTYKASSSSGWRGVSPNSSDIRTFDFELPRGNATVKCGKFFEVRYFLNVVIGTMSKPKIVILQLPIVLIHMNSLDIIPNSKAQVSAAFAGQRLHGRQISTKSQKSVKIVEATATTAPDKQDLDTRKDLVEIGRILESSPRRFKIERNRATPKTDGIDRTERNIVDLMREKASPPKFKLSGLPSRQNALSSQASLTSNHHRSTTEEAKGYLRKMPSGILSRSNNSLKISGPTPVDPNAHFVRPSGSQNMLSSNPMARPFRKMKSTEKWNPGSWFDRGEKGNWF